MAVLLSARELGMTYVRARQATPVKAIDGVTLDVHEGQFVSVVGPSGCGKTTLLKILDGQLTPTEGEILLSGLPLAESRRQRAMVFQEPLLFPWFSVGRNVGYGLECQGVSRTEANQRAKESLRLVGLGPWESHYPHELSGGMQQRANLARALSVDAKLLLMDEPFSSLDAQTRELMQQELLRIWEQAKRTVLFVTHQIAEAIYLADRVVVMNGRPGRIVRDISIDFPRPRGLEIKRTAEFREFEDEIWRLIEAQVVSDFAAEEPSAS